MAHSIVFSDLDGTIIHYPGDLEAVRNQPGVLLLPASSTGKTVRSSPDRRACRAPRPARGPGASNCGVLSLGARTAPGRPATGALEALAPPGSAACRR
jgi:hypothetical protein